MDSIKKMIGILKGSFRRIVREPRFYVAFLWFALLISGVLSTVRTLCIATGIPSSPWLLPLLTDETGNQMFIIIGALILFCDAPFLNAFSGWQILRAGRKKWFWGNMAYIWLLALLYAAGLALIPVLMLIPHVGWTESWGKILGSLAQTSAAAQLGMKNLNYLTMAQYESFQAMLLTCAAIWMNAALIGMVNYVFNLYRRGAGAVVSAVIGLSPLLLIRLASNHRIAYYISPPLWMNPSVYRYKEYGVGPTPAYAFGVLLGVIFFCMVWSYWAIRRKDLNMIEEV